VMFIDLTIDRAVTVLNLKTQKNININCIRCFP